MSGRRRVRDVDVHVEALAADGFGRGEFEGRPVLVRNALPGEDVRARVLKRRAGTWFAEAHDVRQPSMDRRRPACPVFPRCGGCALQHVDYQLQLQLKADSLQAELARNGVQAESIRPPVAGPRLHYRHKARLGVRRVGEHALVGFREGFSSRVVRMSACSVLAPVLARMLPALQATICRLEVQDRIPQVELVAADDDAAVIVRHLVPLNCGDREVLSSFARAVDTRLFLQSGGYDALEPLWPCDARDWMTYSLVDFGLTYRFGLDDFIQVNPEINRQLAHAVVMALGGEGGTVVADLFCGIGNFSLVLARRGFTVTGYDVGRGSIERAARNARWNGVAARCEFHQADLYDAGDELAEGVDQLLLDPPRSGAGPNLESWLRSPSLHRVVYVSCNPVTFAGDAARLLGCGFRLADVGVFDMFPHTAHVETLGVFVRGS